MEKTCANLERDTVATFLATLNQGDVGILPAGTATWTSEITWSPPADVTLKGSGNLNIRGGGDSTIIIDGINRSGFDGALFSITLPSTGYFRLCGITFRTNEDANSFSAHGRVRLYGPGRTDPCFLVDHCHFDRLTYTGLLSNAVYGTIKECKFDDCASRQYGFGNGDIPWSEATDLGTNKFVNHEDNTFVSSDGLIAVNDAYFGGRFRFRHNIMVNTGPQTHPTGGSGRARGSRAWEVYKNEVSSTRNSFNFSFISSGTGIFYQNNFDPAANFSNFITLHAMRRNNSTYTQQATPAGWGYAGTSFNGTGSNWDKNDDPVTGYPCLDIMRGQGDLLSGEFPNCVNVTRGNIGSTDPNCHPHQTVEPMYEWENNWPNPGMGGSKVAVYESDTLLENRDFYKDTQKPGYVEYTYPDPFAQAILDSSGSGGGGGDTGGGTDPDTDPSPSPVEVQVSGTVRFEFKLPQELLDYVRAALNDKDTE